MDHLSDNYFVEKVVVEHDDVERPKVSPQFYKQIEQHQHPTDNFALIKINQTRFIVSRRNSTDRITTLYLPPHEEVENVPTSTPVCAFVPTKASPIHDMFLATDKYAQLYLDE